jgi:chromosome segregation protein
MGNQLDAISRETAEVQRRIEEANAERDRWKAEIDRAHASIAQREAEASGARAALPAAEAAAQQAATTVRATEAEMNTAEQAQGVEEARESHSLKLLAQIEARKNRLKTENMALVFPEPAKLAGIEEERNALRAKIAQMESAQREAEARLPQLDEQRRGATDRLHEATKEVAGLEAALKARWRNRSFSTPSRSSRTGCNRTAWSVASACGRRSRSRPAGTTRRRPHSACG